MSTKKIKRAASTLKALEGVTFESCLDDGAHAIDINKWLIEVSTEVANKGFFYLNFYGLLKYSKKPNKKKFFFDIKGLTFY